MTVLSWLSWRMRLVEGELAAQDDQADADHGGRGLVAGGLDAEDGLLHVTESNEAHSKEWRSTTTTRAAQ